MCILEVVSSFGELYICRNFKIIFTISASAVLHSCVCSLWKIVGNVFHATCLSFGDHCVFDCCDYEVTFAEKLVRALCM